MTHAIDVDCYENRRKIAYRGIIKDKGRSLQLKGNNKGRRKPHRAVEPGRYQHSNVSLGQL